MTKINKAVKDKDEMEGVSRPILMKFTKIFQRFTGSIS